MSLATLDLEVFHGPFDLLLTLVLKEEVDLLEVDLAEVVLAYVEHLERAGELDLEAATEFARPRCRPSCAASRSSTPRPPTTPSCWPAPSATCCTPRRRSTSPTCAAPRCRWSSACATCATCWRAAAASPSTTPCRAPTASPRRSPCSRCSSSTRRARRSGSKRCHLGPSLSCRTHE